jgi:hypothetical protein
MSETRNRVVIPTGARAWLCHVRGRNHGKAEPVMIPSVMANDLEIPIGERVVAGNLPLSHRKVRFEKFRPLCGGQQFVRWNGAAPASGGGVSSRFIYPQPFRGGDTTLLGIRAGYRRHR